MSDVLTGTEANGAPWEQHPIPGLSLVEYSQQNPGKRCPVCSLPSELVAQINEGRSRGITTRVIEKWLNEQCETQLSYGQLDGHFRRGHHEKGAA